MKYVIFYQKFMYDPFYLIRVSSTPLGLPWFYLIAEDSDGLSKKDLNLAE